MGIAAVVGDRLAGMVVFGSASLYGRAWKRVVRGVLADVYGAPASRRDPSETVSLAIATAISASLRRTSAPGCGETLQGSDSGLLIGAIALQGSVYHAFLAHAQCGANGLDRAVG